MPGETSSVEISFVIDSTFTGTSFVNTTEISDDDSENYTDPDGNPYEDTDSDPDGTNDDVHDTTDTDGDGIPDSLDDDIDGDGIPNDQDEDDDGDGIPDTEDEDILDEDDHDPAELMIGQIYDLALTKRVSTEGPFTI